MQSILSESFYKPIDQWTELIRHVPQDVAVALEPIYHLAEQFYEEQSRKPALATVGVPYSVHPVRVARILAEEWKYTDFRTLATCLLHDGIKVGPLNLEQEIVRLAGKEVVDAVWTLTKPRLPESCSDEVVASRDARYFNVLRHAPKWVRLIKCADRIDNLRDACRWGDRAFWERFSADTMGWHLFLARETSPLAEVELFRALVAGERHIRGRAPFWADGYCVDPAAADLIPESIARRYGVVGIAKRGETLVVGSNSARERQICALLEARLNRKIRLISVTSDSIRDALACHLFHSEDNSKSDDRISHSP